MRCSSCGFDNPAGMKFCGQCTAALALVCPKCHSENPPGFKFCGQCTTALTPATIRPGPSKSPVTVREADDAAVLEGERKTVTALFADIKGSTELMEDLDPEEARAIIDPALKLMIDAVHRYDGYVVQSTGDGIFALFGAPVAHEDHPQRALLCGAPDAAGDRRWPAFARRGARADPDPDRTQHRRSRGAPDSDRRAARRVHADWPYGESGLTDADAGAEPGSVVGERGDASAVRGLLSSSGRWDRRASRESASRSMSTK